MRPRALGARGSRLPGAGPSLGTPSRASRSALTQRATTDPLRPQAWGRPRNLHGPSSWSHAQGLSIPGVRASSFRFSRPPPHVCSFISAHTCALWHGVARYGLVGSAWWPAWGSASSLFRSEETWLCWLLEAWGQSRRVQEAPESGWPLRRPAGGAWAGSRRAEGPGGGGRCSGKERVRHWPVHLGADFGGKEWTEGS